MPSVSIRKFEPPEADCAETSKARTILKHAHDAAEGFIDSFSAVRRDRGAGQGTTRDEEQDLLRASVVFAAAGLDSTLKQLIRDGLPRLVQVDEDVRNGLETFIARQLRGEPGDGEAAAGRRFLAKILAAPSRLDELIEQYILDLTGSSLQSADELAKASVALGLKVAEIGIDKSGLKPIFDIRNQIIHELDIKLTAPNRNRASRSRAAMVRHSNTLLELGERILLAVEAKFEA
ncbi:MAG TPA: hypothetical protein VGB83_05960 [Actinomycetota bacterium]